MIPKIEGCIEVVEAGVEGVVIIDGRVPHCVLLELFTTHGVGTLVCSARRKREARPNELRRDSARALQGTAAIRAPPTPSAALPTPPPGSSTSTTRSTRPQCNLFAEVDQRMGEFIAKYLGVPFEHARHLQKSYYRQFGTTLSGLMQVHKLEPQAFLDYVHDIDLSPVPQLPELAAAIEALPGRRLIFTNGSRRHAERVAEKLGVLAPVRGHLRHRRLRVRAKARRRRLRPHGRRHGVAVRDAAMFEDMPHNLEAPHALGMTTVLVHSDYVDHPAQLQMRNWRELPAHIHYATDCLTDVPALDPAVPRRPETDTAGIRILTL